MFNNRPTVQLGLFMLIVEVQWGKEWFVNYWTLRHTLVTHCLRQFDKAGVAFPHTLKPLNQWRSNQWTRHGNASWSLINSRQLSMFKPLEEQFIFSIDLGRNFIHTRFDSLFFNKLGAKYSTNGQLVSGALN